jgi:predicted Rossmann fold nucleotide-binding protein DprA/Smf involved in DNA uptake
MEFSEALADKIEARITELKAEIAAHERALAALGDADAKAGADRPPASNGRRPTARRAARATSTSSRPRRSADASVEAVFDALTDGQDQASEIARQFGVSPAVVRSRLQQLEEAGRVSRSGHRRSTRWRSHAA